jgi:hypothetical protein
VVTVRSYGPVSNARSWDHLDDFLILMKKSSQTGHAGVAQKRIEALTLRSCSWVVPRSSESETLGNPSASVATKRIGGERDFRRCARRY